jgi:hypothetical protein
LYEADSIDALTQEQYLTLAAALIDEIKADAGRAGIKDRSVSIRTTP